MGAHENLDQLQATLSLLPQTINLPLITREKFADLVGISRATCFSACDRGYIPVIRLGGRRVFVNLEAIRAQCVEKVLK